MFIKFQDRYEDYFEYLRKMGRTEKTIEEHQRLLVRLYPEHIKTMWLSRLKKSDVADLIEVGRQHGDHGATRMVVVLRRYFNFLKSELEMELPFDWRDVKVPMSKHKEQPVFEAHEVVTLFNIMEMMEPGSVHGKRMCWTMTALFETLFATGMRIHEPLLLKRGQFAEIKEKKELVITGKGNKERTIYFTDRSIEKLGLYLGRRNDTSDALFVNSCGEPLIMATARSYFERFKRKLRELGHEEIAKKLKSHTFRRTLSTHLFENGADIKAVQKILGHESERTTLKSYIRANAKRAKLIHGSILSKMSFDELEERYKEVDGHSMVRTSPNGGSWMKLDLKSSAELHELVSELKRKLTDSGSKRSWLDFLKGLTEESKLELENVGGC